MNEVIKLLLELQEMANNGYDVDDVKLEQAMQALQNAHNKNIDSNIFLSEEQKKHRKELYKDCVKALKKYAKQSLQDDKEIRNHLLNIKQ